MLVNRIGNANQLKDEFKSYGRDYYKIETYQAILDFYNECFEDTQELDVIGLCGDVSEGTYEEVQSDYDIESDLTEEEELSEEEKTEETKRIVIEYLHEHTSVLYIGENVISFWTFW